MRNNKYCIGKKHPHTEKTKEKLSKHFSENLPKFSFVKGQIPWNKNHLAIDQIEYIKNHSFSKSEMAKKYDITSRRLGNIIHGRINNTGLSDQQIFEIKEKTQTLVQLAKRFNTTPRIIGIVKLEK